MTIFQKLFWFKQIGIDGFCGETKNVFCQKSKEKPVPQKEIQRISKSALSKTATHTLLGTGVVPAKVLCLLNAPNAMEDRTGTYLAGPEGEKTRKMLASIGLDLEKNTYLTYLSPWRPPGNRLLTAVEVSEGLEILDKCLARVRPTYLLVLGAETVRSLIKGKTLSALRAGHCTYKDYPVYATFSAVALMKNPNLRAQAWADLKNFKKHLESE